MKRSRADTGLDPSGVGGGDGPVHLDHAAGEPVMVGIVAHHHRLAHYYLSAPAAKMDRAIASPNLQGEAMAPATVPALLEA